MERKSLKFLLENGYTDWEIASHVEASAEALESLVNNPCARIRRALASNNSAPASALAKLSEDSDENVRINTAWNSNTSESVKHGMQNFDSSRFVRRAAQGKCTVTGGM